jgi:transketolase
LWDALGILHEEISKRKSMVDYLAGRLRKAKTRLEQRTRLPREGVSHVREVYETAEREARRIPDELELEPGTTTTLRAELGRVLNYYNKVSRGAFLVAAADLLGSTSIDKVASGFPSGYYNAATNPESRTLSIGGICEDAMSGLLSGLSSFGKHIGVASSYAAFLAPLGHISGRLHAIGNQARNEKTGEPYRPMILACAHAGLKTGEDGPTHADPQALQLLQENFPPGTMITLTPWDPQELWPLVSAALTRRPALIAPFVTRPTETVLDRGHYGLPAAVEARNGVYAMREAGGTSDGTVVLQGSGVTIAFVRDVLPVLDKEGINLDIYYVASAELFDALSLEERDRIFPEERAREAMGITGFTLPTLYRWIRSDNGRRRSLHPFSKGHYLGSGQAEYVLAEAGLDPESQLHAVRKYLDQSVHV